MIFAFKGGVLSFQQLYTCNLLKILYQNFEVKKICKRLERFVYHVSKMKLTLSLIAG